MDQSFEKQIDELRKQAKAADAIDKERMDLFRGLIRHPGWALYQELLSSRIQLFGDRVAAPAGSVDGAFALEWVKGAMSGLILARDLPSVTIGAIEAAVPATDGEDDDA